MRLGVRRWRGTSFAAFAEFGVSRPGDGVVGAAVGEPVADGVHFAAVGSGVVTNALRDSEPFVLPLEAPLDGPGEDRGLNGGVGAERELDPIVALCLRNHLRERS
jgi:hypothetical protein